MATVLLKEHKQTINEQPYSRWDDDPFWKPENDNQPFYCRCMGTSFRLYYPGGYQLNAVCLTCGADGEVYSG